MKTKTRCASIALSVLIYGSSAMAQPRGWVTYNDDRGTNVQLPADLFSVDRATERGRTFATPDGRATLDIYTGPNERGETPAQTLNRTLSDLSPRLSYTRVTSDFFVISARHERQILYRRCNFDARTIHCLDLKYPASEKRAWDAIVTRISLSLRPR
jgi:hypothetical protein